MADAHLRVECRVPVGEGLYLAATVHLPTPLPAAPTVLFCVAGAGYSRGYFDLPAAGFSQASAAVAEGFVCIALDPLSVGDSSVPPPEVSSMDRVAASAHAALGDLLVALRHRPPISAVHTPPSGDTA